jgi:MFS family permease
VRKSRTSLSFKGFDRQFLFFLGIITIFTLGNSTDAFLLLRAKNLGVPDTLIPMIWLVLHVVKATSSVPGGILSDRIGRRPTLILGWLVYGAIYMGFAQATTTLHAWLLFAAYGLYYGLTEGTEKALVADIVRSEQRGTAYGLYNIAIGVGALPASLLLGFLWGQFGAEVAFETGAGFALVAAVALVLLSSRKSNDLVVV